MFAKKRFLLIIGALLFLTGGAAYALPPRVSWIPPELKPDSIAPGESASYTLTLKHTGILPILLANQLKIVVEGDIVPFVTLTQPTFPPVFKKGNQVNVVIMVSVPSTTPLSVKTGELVLKRFVKIKVGKVIKEVVTDVWRANALPVELTFSAISLPPDPEEVGEATLEGIDLDQNGVRDDIDRYIVFTYPNSAKVREALKQNARELQIFLRDADDKAKTRANVPKGGIDCLNYVYGGVNMDFNAFDKAESDLRASFLNTHERSRAYNKADSQLAGMVIMLTQVSELKAQCS